MISWLLPGLAWMAWSPQRKTLSPSWLADVLAISLSFNGLAGLLTFYAGLSLSSSAPLWLLYFLLAGITLAGWRKNPLRMEFTYNPWMPLLSWLLLLGWRFFQIRNLLLPVWVDSVHHTLIVRQILEKGGIPSTLTPDLAVPFYYHFGFHLNTALLAWAGKLAPSTAVLLGGQILNAAVSLAVYRLAAAIWQDWKRATLAMLLSGFFFRMPAYYTSWGRYPLLIGIFLLLLTLAWLWEAKDTLSYAHRAITIGLLTAGLMISHYFTALLLGIFCLFWGIWILSASNQRTQWHIFLPVLAGGLLALPWLLRMNSLAHFFVKIGQSAPVSTHIPAWRTLSYLWYLLGPSINQTGYVLAALAAGWMFLHKRSRGLIAAAVLMLAMSTPWSPALRPFRPDHWIILMFIPASLIYADMLLTINPQIFKRWPWAQPVSATLLAVLLLAGIWQGREAINPQTNFVTAADMQAITWIEQNLPSDAAFLLNATSWQYQVYRGVDGGWWLLPLTGRQTFPPPVIYTWGEPAASHQISSDAATLSQLSGCTSKFWELMNQYHLSYIYLHEGIGAMQAGQFTNCAGLRPVYQQNGITILAIK